MLSVSSFVARAFGSGATPRRQLQALYGNQAVIEFKPSGAIDFANDAFLALMGYGLSAVKGRHHRMFVDPVEQGTQDYA
ncbi:MAG: methyl-accepting chemotaxis protein, partial [Rhodoferax sp.]|nr:methyl-accepting chemotaxis protein [Rhodoferax sp.]